MITLKPKNVFIVGYYQDHPPPSNTSLIIADLVCDTALVDDIAELSISKLIPSIIICWPKDAWTVKSPPSQVCFWIKPTYSKKPSKVYSRSVELILMYGVSLYEEVSESNRIGVFNDLLLEPLIERLIHIHYPGTGTVYDPCAGSRTVETVCKRLGIPSFSVDIQAPF